MAKTFPFDVTTPPGTESPTEGDNRIRELKDALQERNDEDHYWEKVGNVVDEDNVGFHRKVTLLVSTAPSLKADAGILYSKDVSGKAEFFYIDEDGNEVQLTDAGTPAGTTEFRSGDFMTSKNTSAPSGWTDVSSTYEDKFMRITSGTPLTAGGADTHTHAAGSYLVDIESFNSGTPSNTSSPTGDGGTGVPSTTHTHPVNPPPTSVTGTSASGDNVPAYIEVRLFEKD